MATLYVNKDKKNDDVIQKTKDSFNSTSVSKSKPSNNEDDGTYIFNGRLLNSNNK